MKKLVAYYSYSGNCSHVGQIIAKEMGADVLEIKPKRSLPKGKMVLFVGGFQAAFRYKPKLLPFKKNPDDYDVVVIGTPVWASNMAPAVRSFLKSGIKGKKIALFCCYGGDSGKTFAEMKKMLPGNKIIGEIGFRQPVADKKNSDIKAKKWADEILKKI